MSGGQAFALWITGLPASGKSTITAAVVPRLRSAGATPAVLESDVLRRILTPEARFTPEERDRFYRQMALIGNLLVASGIPVIFDATGHRRHYRDYARSLIGRFVEVYVACSVEVCAARDPKGIYAAASSGRATSVPGMQVTYEPPTRPEISLPCGMDAATAALEIEEKLRELAYL